MAEGDTAAVGNGTGDGSGEGSNLNNSNTEHDPHYEPIVTLPEVVVSTMEENEDEMIKMRAKLFRFDSSETPSEWKDRGTGEVKLLKHRFTHTVRVVMRRDKTLKICANHYVTPWMELTPNCGSDRAWVWSTKADFTDETPRPELLAIRFGNAENAQRWKEKFEEAKAIVAEHVYKNRTEDDSEDDVEEVKEEEEVTDNNKEVTEKNKEVKKDNASPSAEKISEEAKSEETAGVTEQLEKLKVDDKENQESSSSREEK